MVAARKDLAQGEPKTIHPPRLSLEAAAPWGEFFAKCRFCLGRGSFLAATISHIKKTAALFELSSP